jgi:hypothetical protein
MVGETVMPETSRDVALPATSVKTVAPKAKRAEVN